MRKSREVVFGENLRRFMENEGLSQHQLAKKLNMNRSSLHNYLNGILPQGLISMIKISQVFDISLDELIFGRRETRRGQSLSALAKEEKYEVTIKRISPD